MRNNALWFVNINSCGGSDNNGVGKSVFYQMIRCYMHKYKRNMNRKVNKWIDR